MKGTFFYSDLVIAHKNERCFLILLLIIKVIPYKLYYTGVHMRQVHPVRFISGIQGFLIPFFVLCPGSGFGNRPFRFPEFCT